MNGQYQSSAEQRRAGSDNGNSNSNSNVSDCVTTAKMQVESRGARLETAGCSSGVFDLPSGLFRNAKSKGGVCYVHTQALVMAGSLWPKGKKKKEARGTGTARGLQVQPRTEPPIIAGWRSP